MKILSFSCKKVHGYLSFKTEFNQNLTFLTGINGSGKTTAVRAIVSLLTPSIVDLASLAYGQLSVTVESKGEIVIISSYKEDGMVVLTCSNTEGEVKFPIFKTGRYANRTYPLDKEYDFYREQETIASHNPVLAAINALPTPMFLDLERRYQLDMRRRRDEFFHREKSNPLAGSVADSIIYAQDLAERAYRHSLSRRTQLTDILKQNIILAAFEFRRDDARSMPTFKPDWSLEDISAVEKVVIKSLSQIGIHDERVGVAILPFFARVKDVIKNFPSEKELQEFSNKKDKAFDREILKRINDWSIVQPQVGQISRLRDLIVRYNEQVAACFESIERYRNSINMFLHDSNKHISFSPEGILRVKVNSHDASKPIEALSSGEKQLVVILTHLAFNQSSRTNVLIIDEPELSLHIRWQELFVDAVIGASPELQLILATHSPAIIKSRLDNCVDVEEAHHS